MKDSDFTAAVQNELKAARDKFPSSNLSLAALMEEVGELAQAMLQHRAGKIKLADVYKEAVQVAVMAQRVAVEGDPSFEIAYSEP